MRSFFFQFFRDKTRAQSFFANFLDIRDSDRFLIQFFTNLFVVFSLLIFEKMIEIIRHYFQMYGGVTNYSLLTYSHDLFEQDDFR